MAGGEHHGRATHRRLQKHIGGGGGGIAMMDRVRGGGGTEMIEIIDRVNGEGEEEEEEGEERGGVVRVERSQSL